MKALIILSICILAASMLQAQQIIKPIMPFDTSVFKLSKPKLTFQFNNNHFDVYKATPDNMFVIKPDSLNHFTMPVKTFESILKQVTKPD